jgi:hypothetical protein
VAAESNLLGFGIVHLEKEQNVRILVKRTQCLKELVNNYLNFEARLRSTHGEFSIWFQCFKENAPRCIVVGDVDNCFGSIGFEVNERWPLGFISSVSKGPWPNLLSGVLLQRWRCQLLSFNRSTNYSPSSQQDDLPVGPRSSVSLL